MQGRIAMIYQSSLFSKFSRRISKEAGHPLAFQSALGIILLWIVTGPFFHFSDTWQLVINTATTIITFLMVFLIQNTQNRDSEAMQLKLDEIIRSLEGAHNIFLDLEELTEADLDRLKERYGKLAELARKKLKKGKADTGRPEIGTD
jgi:low affinity Fe/Cu permease